MKFLDIFDIVPGFVWAGLLALALVGNFTQFTRLGVERVAHASTKEEFSNYRSQAQERENLRAQAALLDVEKQRDLEKLRRTAAQKAQDDLLAETARTAAARAAAATRRQLLNDDIDRATPRSSPSDQASGSPAALRRAEEAAATFGQLLKTCRAEGDSDAGELEDLAGQVRGLITQYEGLLVSPPATAAQPGG